MTDERSFKYLIIGGGLAGVSAVRGIRELDQQGSILLLAGENHPPYDRPPLSKKLWTGKKQVEDIYLPWTDADAAAGVRLETGRTAVGLDVAEALVTDDHGAVYHYDKLLLATGGRPRRLTVPGGDLPGVFTYRTLDDYLALRAAAQPGRSAVVIGGGFIGSEMAVALSLTGVAVTMVFPGPWLVDRVFPESLGRALQATFIERGIRILSPEQPVALERRGDRFLTRTDAGNELTSDLVVVGIGLVPELELARAAGLETGDGIVVDEHLQTSAPGVYAAGDVAFFPYQALGKRMRVEHWDNAREQGRQAGRNMAGAFEAYTHMPFFYSDLFEFGYEAVGEVDARLEVVADWAVENERGVLYYLRDGQVRGVMLCDVWDKVDAARDIIREGRRLTPSDLPGLIH